MAGGNVSAAVMGAILGPIAGLAATKIKGWLDTRDERETAKRLIGEATDLLEFADALQTSAGAGGIAAKVPSESMAQLHGAVVGRISEAISAISPCSAGQECERDLTRDVLDRVFLLHKPLVWWTWPLHALYYVLFGILVACVPFIIGDFSNHAEDRWVGVGVGAFFAFLTLGVNVISNAADRRHSQRAQVVRPEPMQRKASAGI